MKKMAIIATLCCATVCAAGQTATTQPFKDAEPNHTNWMDFKADFSTSWSSKYVTPGGLVLHDKPVVQSDVSFTHQATGLYAGFWHSAGLDDDDLQSNSGDEMDWYLGWSRKTDMVDFDVSLTYIDNVDFFESRKDVLRPRAKLSKSFKLGDSHVLTPYFGVTDFFPVRGKKPERGV